MPPKKQTSKEQMIEKAFELVRTQGQEYLSARNLAKELSCSTQPIYQAFEDMKQLKNALAEKALNQMLELIHEMTSLTDSKVLAKILGYAKFADCEPKLFQMIYSSDICSLETANQFVKASSELELNLLIYVHGIVIMKTLKTLPLTWEQEQALIMKAYESFCKDSSDMK